MARQLPLLRLTTAILATAALASPASAQTVGSVSLATLRHCSDVGPGGLCNGESPGQALADYRYGGGIGIAGSNELAPGVGNIAHSEVSFGGFDLPVIRGWTSAPGDVRMNINVFGLQSYLIGGTAPTPFSISGAMHVVDSSTNATDSSLPGGAHLSAYVGIWDASILSGYGSDPQSLFSGLFYAPCGTAGVLGVGLISQALTGGEHSYSLSTTACAPGSLTFAPGTEILVVAGMQLPTNRGGFVDASHTFTTQLDPALGSTVQAEILATTQSAIARGAVVTTVPEPSSWVLLAGGVLSLAAWRRR